MLQLMKDALVAATTKYLQKNLPLESTQLKDVCHLLLEIKIGIKKFKKLRLCNWFAEKFSHVIKEQDVSVAKDQWFFINKNRYQTNDIRILPPKFLNLYNIGPRFLT